MHHLPPEDVWSFIDKTYGLTPIRRIIFLWYYKDSTCGTPAGGIRYSTE